MTGQKTCERLIKQGFELAGDRSRVNVLHVAKEGNRLLGSEDEAEALGYLFRVSSEYAAEMNVVRSEDVLGTVHDMAEKTGANVIIIGAKRKGDAKGKAFGAALRALMPEIQIIEMIASGE